MTHRLLVAPGEQLVDGNVSLRLPRKQDAGALGMACVDTELASWVEPPVPTPTAAGYRLLSQFQLGWEEGRIGSFLYVPSEVKEVGAVIVLMVEDDPAVAEIAYWVSPALRGRGIATRSVTLVARWAFHRLPLQRLWLEIEPGNAASHRVAERSGFQREGLLRSHCRDRRSGSRHDCVVYSLLPDDLR
ncbi:GNAT family N-acetyltransferase [soil metagenome]